MSKETDMSKTHVFISYARSDAAEVANLLQRQLEGYRIPRKLVGKDVPLPESKYLRRVFVDTEDLSVSKDSFHVQLKRELEDAKFLIVLCSKAAARADSFVHKEIEYFIARNDGDTSRVLPIVLDGVGEDAIPVALRNVVKERNIVLWDREWPSQGRLGKAHLHSAYFKVLEFLLGVDAGVLNNRYWITWRRRIIRAVCIGASVLLALVAALTHDVRSQMQRVEEQEKRVIEQTHRVKFERQVFPLSIDYSYMKAFAAPLIAGNRGTNCVIIIAMPKNCRELENEPAVKKAAILDDAKELGWQSVGYKCDAPGRGRPVYSTMIRPNGKDLSGVNVYVDTISQLSAMKMVLDYLTTDNPFHSIDEKETLLHRYLEEFKSTLNDLLGKNMAIDGCLWKLEFVKDKDELKKVLESIAKPLAP